MACNLLETTVVNNYDYDAENIKQEQRRDTLTLRFMDKCQQKKRHFVMKMIKKFTFQDTQNKYFY